MNIAGASLDDLAPGLRLVTLPPGVPEYTLGFGVARWMESNLIQPNGPRARQVFRLRNSQLRFLAWFYAVDENGEWLFSRAVRRLAKGSGKSPFAAALCLAELCGPVRLRDFDGRLPGGCIGRPMDMPWVQIAATAESQTANTMRMVRAFAPKGSPIVEKYRLDPGKTMYYMQPEGKLEVITSSATAAEGAESSFIVGDETEHWKPSNGGHELINTLVDNLTKSDSRLLETCNAWVPDTDTVAQATYDAWVLQEEGKSLSEGRILYDARIAPAETEMADPESLRAALEFVYDDCLLERGGWQKIRPIMNRIYSAASDPDDSKRKYLNRPSASLRAWTDPEKYAANYAPDIVVPDDEPIVLFFDGSKSDDSTGLLGCDMEHGYTFVLGCWERPRQLTTRDRWSVDRVEVDRVVREVLTTRTVVAFFADVAYFESYVDAWAADFGGQFLVDATGGKDRHAVAFDMRSNANIRDFTLAVMRAKVDIEAGEYPHDGDSRAVRHFANARSAPNRYGTSIAKEGRESPNKIDLAVCSIGARMVRRRVLASPAWETYEKPKGKVAGVTYGWR